MPYFSCRRASAVPAETDVQNCFVGFRASASGESDIHGWYENDDKGERIPVDVKVGDKVLYSKYGGTEVHYEGEDYLIVSSRDVLAILG